MIRFLGSTKLTIALCLLLAAGGVAGSLLYQGNTAFGKVSSFNVFRSPLFLVPGALLLLNMLFCVVPKIREMPPGSPRTWTFASLHLGILLLSAGLAWDGMSGFVGTQYYPVGQPYAGHRDWRAEKDGTFPFTVEVASAEVRYHPINLQIGVKDSAGRKVGLFVAREGVPIAVGNGGMVVTPRKFEVDGKKLLLEADVGGKRVGGLIATENSPATVTGYSIVPVAFHDPEPSGYIATVRFRHTGRPPEERTLRINAPASFEGITFCIVSMDRDRYGNTIVGLQMTREPGAPLFWAGALLFGAALVGQMSLKMMRVAALSPLLLAALLPAVSHAFGVVVDSDTTWSGEVRVTEPVSVEKGATLRVLPGTVVLLSGDDRNRDGCPDGGIQVYGTLRIEGERGRPVRFSRIDPAKPWDEIFLKDANATIAHAVVEGAGWGLHIHDGDVRVERTVLRGNGGGARMKGTGVSFLRCTVTGNGIGLRFWEGGPRVTLSVIEGNGTGLFYRDGAGGGKITGSRISNREWDVKVGDWATGDLDLSGNFWGRDGSPGSPRVQDYRERRGPGKVALDAGLAATPRDAGADAPEGER
ncbi:MAG: hypothetical protein C4529_00995 [Deltaproteobacteria bacterium]|nr:MAG: hypothetical protein C4529_00995 [Deltaproteobacteria bacterium]